MYSDNDHLQRPYPNLSREGSLRLNWCSVETDVEEVTLLDTVTADEWKLVLYNDEHNTFDHVIELLVGVCGHDSTQAEQCAMLIHFKGKCTVMSGAYDDLEPRCSKLLQADLTAEIEA